MKIDKRVVLSLVLLAGLVLAEAFLHRGVNYEIEACSAWHMDTVFGGAGCTSLVNGQPYHVEGTVNLKNAYFFAGGSDRFSLSYEIATNRLLFPYMASFLVPLAGGLLEAMALLNLICWILASWAMYGLGRNILASESLGLIMGVLTATGIGFIATWMGTKAHLFSYAFFIMAIYLFERIGLFKGKAPAPLVGAAGLVIGLGAFANNLHLPLTLYCLFRGGRALGWRRLISLVVIAALPVLLLKGAFEFADISTNDRTGMVLGHLTGHAKLVYSLLVSNSVEPMLMNHGPVRVVTDPLLPFAWLPEFLLGLAMIGGVPLAVLAALGLGFLKGRAGAVGIAVIAASAIAVFIAHTYWPFWRFSGYTAYYTVFGLFLIAALGIETLGALAAGLARRFRVREAVTVGNTVVVLIAVFLIAYVNEDLLTGRQIQFFRFYNSYQMDFPADWDFHKMDW